jgi:hypothetical protein
MKVFIWKNGRPEAQSGYNDDLVMSFGIGMYLKRYIFKVSTTISRLNSSNAWQYKRSTYTGGYSTNQVKTHIVLKTDNGMENISWLL